MDIYDNLMTYILGDDTYSVTTDVKTEDTSASKQKEVAFTSLFEEGALDTFFEIHKEEYENYKNKTYSIATNQAPKDYSELPFSDTPVATHGNYNIFPASPMLARIMGENLKGKEGCYIAGGSIRNYFELIARDNVHKFYNSSLKDIDYFFTSQENFDKGVKAMRELPYSREKYSTNNSIGFKYKANTHDLVRRDFKDIYTCLDEFDMSVSRVGVIMENNIVFVVQHKNNMQDLRERRIVFDMEITKLSVSRLENYINYGYDIDLKNLEKALTAIAAAEGNDSSSTDVRKVMFEIIEIVLNNPVPFRRVWETRKVNANLSFFGTEKNNVPSAYLKKNKNTLGISYGALEYINELNKEIKNREINKTLKLYMQKDANVLKTDTNCNKYSYIVTKYKENSVVIKAKEFNQLATITSIITEEHLSVAILAFFLRDINGGVNNAGSYTRDMYSRNVKWDIDVYDKYGVSITDKKVWDDFNINETIEQWGISRDSIEAIKDTRHTVDSINLLKIIDRNHQHVTTEELNKFVSMIFSTLNIIAPASKVTKTYCFNCESETFTHIKMNTDMEYDKNVKTECHYSSPHARDAAYLMNKYFEINTKRDDEAVIFTEFVKWIVAMEEITTIDRWFGKKNELNIDLMTFEQWETVVKENLIDRNLPYYIVFPHILG